MLLFAGCSAVFLRSSKCVDRSPKIGNIRITYWPVPHPPAPTTIHVCGRPLRLARERRVRERARGDALVDG